jgi:threonine dehydrogenase-like Zn-dependent dehydrogenase
VNRERDDPVALLRALGGAHYALETSGNTAVLRQAVDLLAGNGVCAVVGAPPFGSEVPLDVPAMLTGNPHIVGVNQGSSVPDEFLPALMSCRRRPAAVRPVGHPLRLRRHRGRGHRRASRRRDQARPSSALSRIR